VILTVCSRDALSSWSIFRFFFSHSAAQLPTLSSFHIPLSSYKNHSRRQRSNNKLLMIVSFNEPTTTIYTRQDYSMRSLHWHPYRTGRSTNHLRTPWDLPGYYCHGHHVNPVVDKGQLLPAMERTLVFGHGQTDRPLPLRLPLVHRIRRPSPSPCPD
jgi:hypothetical protein